MIKETFYSITSKILIFFLSFTNTIIITQIVGAYGKGELTIILSIAGILNLIYALVISPATVYFIPKEDKNLVVSSLLTFFIVASFFSLLTIFVFFRENFTATSSILISLLMTFPNIFLYVLYGNYKIKYYSILNILIFLFQVSSVAVIFFLIGLKNVKSIIISYYFSYVIWIIIITIFVVKKEKIVLNFNLKKIFTFFKIFLPISLLSQLGSIFQYLNYRADFFILNYFHGASSVGVYSIGTSLSEHLWLISGSISMVVYSKISNIQDEEQKINITRKAANISFYITLIMTLAILALPSGFWTFVFGKDFLEVRYIIFPLSLGIIAISLSIIVAHYFAGKGKFYINLIAAAIGLVLTIIFDFLLIPELNFYGAGIASSISYLAISIFLIIIFNKNTKTTLRMLLNPKNFIESSMLILNRVKYNIGRKKI